MTALKVLAAVLLALFLLWRVRAGGSVEYSREGVLVRARVGAFWFRIFPAKGAKKEKEKKATQTEQPPAKKGGGLGPVKDLLPLACQAAGELKRRIRIDMLLLELTFAGSDPASTAMAFGYSNAAIGMLLPLFEHNFNVKEHRVRTAMDFTGKEPTVYIYAAFSARIGQLVSFALRYGWKLLRLGLNGKTEQKTPQNMKKEAS